MSHNHTLLVPALEPSIVLGNGRTARRCQAVRRCGEQCKQPARTDFAVCWKHGAGSRKRELAKKAKVTGRPCTTGQRSKKPVDSIQQIAERYLICEKKLNSSDRALATAHALLEWHIHRCTWLDRDVESLTRAVAVLIDLPERLRLASSDADRRAAVSAAGASIRQARESQRAVFKFMRDLAKAASRIVRVLKIRAQIEVIQHEDKQWMMFFDLLSDARGALEAVGGSAEQIALFDLEVKRRILKPRRKTMPDAKRLLLREDSPLTRGKHGHQINSRSQLGQRRQDTA